MPLIDARGRRVHVQEMGAAGPRVVLIHPLGDDLSTWYFTAAPLLARSFRVLLYDLRGHGLSGFATEGYDLRTLGRDLVDLLDERVGDEPVRIGGHSSGGALALRFALDHPERVHSLAVVDAPLPPYPSRYNPLVAEAVGEALDNFPSEELPVRRGRRRRTRELNRRVRLRNESTFTEDFEAEPGFMDDLPGLERPTRLLYGDRSPFLGAGRDLERAIPDATLEVLRGGHVLPVQRRELVADLLAEFFA